MSCFFKFLLSPFDFVVCLRFAAREYLRQNPNHQQSRDFHETCHRTWPFQGLMVKVMTVVTTPKERNEHCHCWIVFSLFLGAGLLKQICCQSDMCLAISVKGWEVASLVLEKKKVIDEAKFHKFLCSRFPTLAFLDHSVILICRPCHDVSRIAFYSTFWKMIEARIED